MTVYEILDQAWIEAGEPSDMDAMFSSGSFDPASLNGGARMLRYINNAIVRIANWKFRDGRLLRLRANLVRKPFRMGAPFVDMALSGAASGFDIAGFAGINVAGQFDGWIVEITAGTGIGQIRLIVTSTGTGAADCTCLVNEDWETEPDATSEMSLYKSFVKFTNASTGYLAYHLLLDPVLTLGDVLKVRDLTSGQDLTPVLREDVFTGNLTQTGIPTQYKVWGDALWFDVALEEPRSYEILYIRQPAKVTVGTDVPDIPEQYHEALGLWVAHNLQRVYQDYEKAYATKRELEDIMSMTRTQGDSTMDLEAGGLTVWG